MSTSLSSLVDNLSEIYGKKCSCKSVCDFIELKDDKLNKKCKECKKIWLMSINGLIKRFPNVYQFCNGDTNKFIVLLRREIYPYQDMGSWERFNKTSLPDKKSFLQ